MVFLTLSSLIGGGDRHATPPANHTTEKSMGRVIGAVGEVGMKHLRRTREGRVNQLGAGAGELT